MPAIFTQAQVRTMCISAGFTPADAAIAAAISMVEAPYSAGGKSYSNFDLIGDQALATAVWGYSYGGFQIRSLRAQSGTGGPRDEKKLTDPAFNCRSALYVLRTQGFKAWSTYNTGQYKAYLQSIFPPPPGAYIVVGGDSLSKITQRLAGGKWSWQDLSRVNGLHAPYTIFIGQALLLPLFPYTVRAGDSLGAIVATYAHGVTVAQVVSFNQLPDADTIQPGQVILIPRASFLES